MRSFFSVPTIVARLPLHLGRFASAAAGSAATAREVATAVSSRTEGERRMGRATRAVPRT
jgi:hypothetical protein